MNMKTLLHGQNCFSGQGTDKYKMNGAGEMLVFSATDFEKFQMPRPELATMMEADLKK